MSDTHALPSYKSYWNAWVVLLLVTVAMSGSSATTSLLPRESRS